MRKTLIVVYADGAAHPGDIAVGLADWARCVFVTSPDDHTRAMEPLLAGFGPVVTAGSPAQAAAKVRAYEPEGIVTYSERALAYTGELAEALGLPFHGRRTVGLLTDKWQQRDALRAAGVDAVRCRRIDSVEDWADAVAETGLPAVLKPAHGGGSRNTFFVEDAGEGLALARTLLAEDRPGLVAGGTLVLEEYLPGRDTGAFGDYVSVESVVRDGTVLDIAVTGKFPMVPPFRETGRFWPSPLEPAEEHLARDLARRSVEALGIREGLTHTEIKLTPDGPRLIEVNGRLGAASTSCPSAPRASTSSNSPAAPPSASTRSCRPSTPAAPASSSSTPHPAAPARSSASTAATRSSGFRASPCTAPTPGPAPASPAGCRPWNSTS